MTPDQLSKQFALAIRHRRKRLGLFQWQIAERMGVARETVTRMECGKRTRIGIEQLAELAEALEVNLSSLLREAENNEQA